MSYWRIPEPAALLTDYHSLASTINCGKIVRFIARITSQSETCLSISCPDSSCSCYFTNTIEASIPHAVVNGTLCMGDLIEIIGLIDQSPLQCSDESKISSSFTCEVHIIRNVNALDYNKYLSSIAALSGL